MILYADASALVKRYVAEDGSVEIQRWTRGAEQVACCQIGYTEVYRAIHVAKLPDLAGALQSFESDWLQMLVIDVDETLSRRAGVLAVQLTLRSLDALHLAAAESIRGPQLQFVAWDRHLREAARTLGLAVLP